MIDTRSYGTLINILSLHLKLGVAPLSITLHNDNQEVNFRNWSKANQE